MKWRLRIHITIQACVFSHLMSTWTYPEWYVHLIIVTHHDLHLLVMLRSDLELDTPLNLSLISPCINPDLADYPELDDYLLL